MTASSVEEKRTWCGICEAACGLIATIESGRLTAVRPDPDHPASQGFACAKGLAWPSVLSDPDRVTSPLRRTKGGTFEEVTWEAALGEIGRRLRAQVKEHGTESIGLIEGNPVAANYSAFLTFMGMASALKTKHFYTTGSVDINNYFVVNQLLYGHTLTTPIPDFERTDFALIVGANPLVSHGSMGTLGRVQDHLRDLVQRGGRLVVVDPRRTETADLGLHLPIRPGGDPWLLAAMLKVILRDGLVDEEFVRRNTTGLESLHHLVAQVDLDRAAAECGIPRDQIEELATDLASARSAAVYGRCGASLGQSSTLTKFLLDSVAIVTGNLDRAGAMVFSQPYFDAEKLTKLMGLNGVGRWHTRVDQFPEVLETAPMVSLAREIMTPGKGQMRAAIAVSSNFVMTSPGMLTEAVRSLDLFVSTRTSTIPINGLTSSSRRLCCSSVTGFRCSPSSTPSGRTSSGPTRLSLLRRILVLTCGSWTRSAVSLGWSLPLPPARSCLGGWAYVPIPPSSATWCCGSAPRATGSGYGDPA